MKKIFKIVIMITLSFVLFACNKTRQALFTTHINTTTYTYKEADELVFMNKKLSYFSITFTDTMKEANSTYKYKTNEFGDLSFSNIRILDISLLMNFGSLTNQYDIDFKGKADKNRANAYEIVVKIDGLSLETNEFTMILELIDPVDQKDEKATEIKVTIKSLKPDQNITFKITT